MKVDFFKKKKRSRYASLWLFPVFFTVVLFGKIGLLLYGLAFSIPKFQIQLLKLDTQSQCNLIGFRLVFLANDSSRRVLWGKQYRNGIPKPFWTLIFIRFFFANYCFEHYNAQKGELLKSINSKTVRWEGISISLSTYVLFSVAQSI